MIGAKEILFFCSQIFIVGNKPVGFLQMILVGSQDCILQLLSQGMWENAGLTREGSSQSVFSYFQTQVFKEGTSSLIGLAELELGILCFYSKPNVTGGEGAINLNKGRYFPNVGY